MTSGGSSTRRVQTEGHVLPDEYERTLGGLIALTRPLVKNIVLMTPFYIEPSRADLMRARTDQYGVDRPPLVGGSTARCSWTRRPHSIAVLTDYYPATLAWDRVHPNQTGHMVIARAFLAAVDFAWQGD